VNIREIGYVVSGSIKEGVKILLSPKESIEDYPLGSLLSIKGDKYEYLVMINNIGVKGSEALITDLFRDKVDLLKPIVESIGDRYNIKWLEAILIAQMGDEDAVECDTFPGYTSVIPTDYTLRLEKFFQREDNYKLWNIGVPKTPGKEEVYVPIDVSRLIELSFGIYGKSGTGKTFLGNIIAGYIALYNRINLFRGEDLKPIHLLLFDMHSEYGLYLKDNMGNKIADGVGRLMRSEFEIFSPSQDLYKKYRDISSLRIYLYNLTLDDIWILSKVFGLTETFIRHLPTLSSLIKKETSLGEKWIWGLFISEQLDDILDKHMFKDELIYELRNNLSITDFGEFRRQLVEKITDKVGSAVATSFVTQTSKLYRLLSYPITIHKDNDSISRIVDLISSRDGCSVIISMGHYEREIPLYMMIANLIARKIHAKLAEVEESDAKILIFLEEAHKFLGKDVYYQSPFGVVAREMRKKGVTIAVIDQRPSELDKDVISMLWTNFVFTLTNPQDIESAVSGTPNPRLYSGLIARLQKKNALVYGEAIKFPVILDIIDYRKFAAKIKRYIKEYAKTQSGIRKDLF
jgi:hypothetical protein